MTTESTRKRTLETIPNNNEPDNSVEDEVSDSPVPHSPAKWFKQNSDIAVDGETSDIEESCEVNNDERNSSGSRSICCTISPCNGRTAFRDTADYELHYSTTHCYVCKECPHPGRTMPDKRILEMHFTECHNPFFEEKKSRGEQVFQCLVIGCPKAFATAKGRRLHLIDVHKYPKSFDFEVVHRGIRTQEQKMKDEQQRESVNERQRGRSESKDGSSDHRKDPIDRPKPDRIPSTNDPLDRLATCMAGLRVRVPEQISFGHHRQKGFPQSVNKGQPGRRNQTREGSRRSPPVADEMEVDAKEKPKAVTSYLTC